LETATFILPVFIVKNNAVEYRLYVKWCRLIWAADILVVGLLFNILTDKRYYAYNAFATRPATVRFPYTEVPLVRDGKMDKSVVS